MRMKGNRKEDIRVKMALPQCLEDLDFGPGFAPEEPDVPGQIP